MPELSVEVRDGDIFINAGPHVERLVRENKPFLWDWMQRLLGDVILTPAKDPLAGDLSSRDIRETVACAKRYGQRWATLITRNDRWREAGALFEILALAVLDSDRDLAHALVFAVPHIYAAFARKDRRLLAGTNKNGKPVYQIFRMDDLLKPSDPPALVQAVGARLSYVTSLEAINHLLQRSLAMLTALTWPFFDQYTLDLIPDRLAGVSVLFAPEAPEDVETIMRDTVQRRRYVLPLTGVTVLPPTNTAGITKLTIWERGMWLIAVLEHGLHGNSMFLCCPALPGHLSLWTLASGENVPAVRDPLAYVAVSAWRDLVTTSDRALDRRTRTTEGEVRSARETATKKDAQHFWYVPRLASGDSTDNGRAEGRRRSLVPRRVAPHAVSGHLRRLAGNKKRPSAEALAVAQEMGLAVPAGYTFVRPYVTGQTDQQQRIRPTAKRRGK